MVTSQKVKKHQTPRSFSQASLRNLTRPKPEDIFISDPNEDIEFNRKMLEEEEERKKILNHVFISGKKYFIADSGHAKDRSDDFKIFVYVKKDGVHHTFRHLMGGWRRTYTDLQLIGKTIEEVD